MKKKFFGIGMSAILCLSLLTGCQLGSRTTGLKEEGPVTVYAVDIDSQENQEVLQEQRDYELTEYAFIEDYNNSVDGSRKIEVQLFADAETMNQQIFTEVLSGG